MLNVSLSNRRCSGFTLLEVLVAILVLAIGLLGLAGLQVAGLRADHSAFHRSQATMLAYDILDVLRANRQDARNGAYNLNLEDGAPIGNSRAAQDLNRWLAELANRLPEGDGGVTVVNNLVTVIVQWDDSRGTEAPQQFQVQSQL
ncbi:type IV pilus modification protein PilV [Methylocaldum szegediense]|uniref:Type IV pilus assembly protein PilV n=1 Tax=Methylocaldum szegediense TaxID=73780 RepID=A0ABM9I436_9GAMM|nr:type IV pilus modification protein PilV [Methylocaldum szegediense]CAI8877083.1 type IV pilus assembly protein PilV [Methylocaldum szegediense]